MFTPDSCQCRCTQTAVPAFIAFIFAVYYFVSACPLLSLFNTHRFFRMSLTATYLSVVRLALSSTSWNATVECHAHKRPSFVHIICQINPPHSLPASTFRKFFQVPSFLRKPPPPSNSLYIVLILFCRSSLHPPLLPLIPRYLPQHPVIKRPQPLFFSVGDKISHPHKATGTYIVLCMFSLLVSNSKRGTDWVFKCNSG